MRRVRRLLPYPGAPRYRASCASCRRRFVCHSRSHLVALPYRPSAGPEVPGSLPPGCRGQWGRDKRYRLACLCPYCHRDRAPHPWRPYSGRQPAVPVQAGSRNRRRGCGCPRRLTTSTSASSPGHSVSLSRGLSRRRGMPSTGSRCRSRSGRRCSATKRLS